MKELFQVKKEEKEFIEEEKEEDKECQLEKKQLEERLISCNNSVSNLENQNRNLSSSGEACRKQLAGMMRFKELSENCLKDMERQHAREEKDHQAEKLQAPQQSSLDQAQSELRKCREDLRERLKVKIEQTEKLHADLNNCEKLHTDLNNCEVRLNVTTKKESEQNAKINRDLSQCKESLQQYQSTNVSKCEEQTKTIENRCNALETELKEIKVKCETCQSTQRENSSENSQTGRDAEIGGYSYIMQILYKYGLL